MITDLIAMMDSTLANLALESIRIVLDSINPAFLAGKQAN
jgi:hypothetical protein